MSGRADRRCTRREGHGGEHYCCGRITWRDGESPQPIDQPPTHGEEVAAGLKKHLEASILGDLDHRDARRALREFAIQSMTVLAPCGCKVKVPVNRFTDETRHRQCAHGVWSVVMRRGEPDLSAWTITRRARGDCFD